MKFRFPKIKAVSIKYFSLYEKKKNLDLVIDNGVFCLAGANGLGKSTFLNILNYCLTGVVVDPAREFSSIVSTAKFYNFNKKFAIDYFDGRIEEIDREKASVEMTFSVGEIEYNIERSLFDSGGLIKFRKGIEGKLESHSDLDEGELFKLYNESLIVDIGLASFDQFVFLQHYVLSFDEHHHLLFWDRDLMETSLYLFFGVDVEDAKKANELRKDIKRYGSLIRNFTYHRNKLVKDTEELKKTIADKKKINLPDGIQEEYENINVEIGRLEKAIESKKSDLIQIDYNIANLSFKLTSNKTAYQNLFNELFKSKDDDIFKDQEVLNLLLDLKNAICKGEDTQVIFKELSTIILKNHCVDSEPSTISFDELQEIDSEIGQIGKEIESEEAKRTRIREELSKDEKSLIDQKKRLGELDTEFGTILNQIKELAKSDYSGVLKVYENQIEEKTNEINDLRLEKKEFEKEFKKLERVLNRGYSQAEENFFPLFNKYANDFLGLEVDVKLRNSTKGSTLILIIEDSERNETFQLSESQRYFIDIALRMSLIEHSCDSATLLIDTPEGSLDIAYESRAGKMFGDFAKKGFNLIMTANINTSQLLIELARTCSTDNMKLERMTEWTHLSKVQYEEEKKIIDAYSTIEEELKK